MRKSLTSFGAMFVVLAIPWFVMPTETVNVAQAQGSVAEVPVDADAEAEFLEELHYSHEDFLRIYESLPRDEENKVDWERAVESGLIEPAASIDDDVEELLMDLRIVIKFNDMLIKDVVFSHEVHTYWLNCDSCHPKLFNPEVESNHMTMKEMREGKYCGHCHGMVAFPTNIIDAPNFRANCLRCHRAQRG
jgi:c(7)-type cytochrome triheme protein